jgi:ubiquinone/menaquinone biosynthesis C-methylase UbiE
MLLKAHIRIEHVRPAAVWNTKGDRFSYQEKVVHFEVGAGQQVLDIGSGGNPFPYATVLVDRYPDRSNHRTDDLETGGKPFVIADIDRLPFSDQAFDYVYCSHVLEHVDDPIAACREIMRVGKRGYIETPTLAKDMMFSWAKGMHRWHVVGIGQTLCFFEYGERQAEGIQSSAWADLIFSSSWHPLQDVFERNQEVFNVMLTWSAAFRVFVFYLDGRSERFAPAGERTTSRVAQTTPVPGCESLC